MKLGEFYKHSRYFMMIIILLIFISKTNFTKLIKINKKNIPLSKNELQVENTKTIVEYKQSSTTPISYYYPFFFRIGLLVFQDEKALNFENLSKKCDDLNCHYCDPLYPSKCLKCNTGFFLHEEGCDATCPKGFVADILRQNCVESDRTDSTNFYIKTYSIGSCVNKCNEKKVQDCSCNELCKNDGSCCYDYTTHGCDVLMDKGREMQNDCKNIENCKLCDNSIMIGNALKCNQCLPNYYLYQGKCYKECPEDTYEDNQNNLCKVITSCSSKNCSECIEGTIYQCKQCNRGYFLFQEQCEEICPLGYRADRISWSCLEYPVFSWFIVLPSTSCKDMCFKQSGNCNCDTDCFRRGDCCQDIQEYCVDQEVLRKRV